MKILRMTILLVAVLALQHLAAQHTNIMISNTSVPEEPTIYIDPNNPNRIIAGANINNLFYSNDGGFSWEVKKLYSSAYGVAGDPMVIVDEAGNYYYFHLSNPANGNWLDRIVCQKSTDGGVTWNQGSYMGLNGKDQDKPWVVVDRNNGNIYTTWTQFDIYGSSNPQHRSNIMFSKSSDSGESWSEAMRINEVDGNCVDSDETVEGAVPAVGPNGEIYVCWAGPLGLVFDRSTDQGETWLENDIFVSDFPGGWDFDIPGISRCNGFPITVCDLSGGPNHGTIFINWSDQRNGTDDTDVWLVKSTDGGNTWSERIRVNDDPPGKQQFFTWMAIDQITGHLHFVFYDRRNYDDTNTDVYMATSTDGGETISNYKISEEPFVPASGVFFGDYNNLSAVNNVIRPIWTRLHNGQLSVWTAIIDTTLTAIANHSEPAIPFALNQNYPNPFSATTHFSFKLRSPATVTLKIYDLYGRHIASLIDHERLDSGMYLEHFDARKYNLTPGVYYFSLTGDNVNRVRMMVVE